MTERKNPMKKILVVEDDELVQKAVKRFMALYGIEVIPAFTLKEAEDKFFAYRAEIDLVVLDGCVPGNILNTLYLIDLFKEAHEEVVILGASGNPEYNEQLTKAGCHFTTDKIDVVQAILKHFKFI